MKTEQNNQMEANISESGSETKKKRNIRARIMKTAALLVFGTAVLAGQGLTANAANTSIVTEKFDVLKDIVTAVISCIGVIYTLWGISEWGMGFQSQDGMTQAQSLKRIGGGLIMILAPQILSILV